MKMENMKMKIMYEITSLRFDLDNYKNDRDWDMVRKIRLKIAKLENMLSETYWQAGCGLVRYSDKKEKNDSQGS